MRKDYFISLIRDLNKNEDTTVIVLESRHFHCARDPK